MFIIAKTAKEPAFLPTSLEGYEVVKSFKYLGILISYRGKITNHQAVINEKMK